MPRELVFAIEGTSKKILEIKEAGFNGDGFIDLEYPMAVINCGMPCRKPSYH